jgi:hypothetical protein
VNKLFHLVCTLYVLALVAGCASLTGTDYPKSWAPIDSSMTADACPKVEGTYSDQGAQSFPAESGKQSMLSEAFPHIPRLSEVFTRVGQADWIPKSLKKRWPELPKSVSVQISQTPETIKVTFFGENHEQTSLDFRRYHFNLNEKRFDDLFVCYSGKEPRLRFMAEPEHKTRGGAGGVLVFLLKAADGSLIVQWRTESFPVMSAVDSIWWRYPQQGDAR